MSDKQWRSYEEVAQFLLNEFAAKFGLARVEGKQSVHGRRSNTEWEIEGKGVYSDEAKFVIMECRRYTTSRVKQEAVGALAYRISDTGAEGALLVTPLPLQEGAAKVAAAEKVVSVILRPDSTNSEYMLQFLDQICLGLSDNLGPITDKLGIVLRNATTGEVMGTRGDASVVADMLNSQTPDKNR